MTNPPLLGIDLGGTKTAVILGNPSGEVIARKQFATSTPPETRRRITEAARGFGRDFSRVGIACGGPSMSRAVACRLRRISPVGKVRN